MLFSMSVFKFRGEFLVLMRVFSFFEELFGFLEDFYGLMVWSKRGLLQLQLEEVGMGQFMLRWYGCFGFRFVVLRFNLNMDWGMLVCTKGIAFCSFSICIITLLYFVGIFLFRFKFKVEFWFQKVGGVSRGIWLMSQGFVSSFFYYYFFGYGKVYYGFFLRFVGLIFFLRVQGIQDIGLVGRGGGWGFETTVVYILQLKYFLRFIGILQSRFCFGVWDS